MYSSIRMSQRRRLLNFKLTLRVPESLFDRIPLPATRVSAFSVS